MFFIHSLFIYCIVLLHWYGVMFSIVGEWLLSCFNATNYADNIVLRVFKYFSYGPRDYAAT